MSEPIELIAIDEPHQGMIDAHREDEPSFTEVQRGERRVITGARSRSADLVISEYRAAQMADDLSTVSPS